MQTRFAVVLLAVGTLAAACNTARSTVAPSGSLTAPSSTVAAAATPSRVTTQAVGCTPDTTPPSISSVSATPNSLWPPNHKMVVVTVRVTASDNCSAVTTRISGVSSNEPVNGLGDGNTSPDWVVTGALTLQLRAERAGVIKGPRIYTITVTATDAAGNQTSRTTTVTVAHDQGHR